MAYEWSKRFFHFNLIFFSSNCFANKQSHKMRKNRKFATMLTHRLCLSECTFQRRCGMSRERRMWVCGEQFSLLTIGILWWILDYDCCGWLDVIIVWIVLTLTYTHTHTHMQEAHISMRKTHKHTQTIARMYMQSAVLHRWTFQFRRYAFTRTQMQLLTNRKYFCRHCRLELFSFCKRLHCGMHCSQRATFALLSLLLR